MKRRSFLKAVSGVTALFSLPHEALSATSRRVYRATVDDNPISKTSDAWSQDFNGDDTTRPHDAFWNLDGYIQNRGGEPTQADEHLDVVIVGGGMSGLISAYYLESHNYAVLEMDSRFGGNSKGETYRDSTYSIGAAYIVTPEAESPIATMLEKIQVAPLGRIETAQETTVALANKLYRGFWQGQTDPEARVQFESIFARLYQMMQEEDFDFTGEWAKQLDALTFEQWLQQEFGSVHEHIKEYFQLYGWSSFCASIDEISAFQYLSFICFETDSIMAFPGGNACITQGLTKYLKNKNPNSLRSLSTVLKVHLTSSGAEVIYENAFGELKKISCKKVIMANQKFVARRMISAMPKEQDSAISRLLYRSYLVANIILKQKYEAPSFELYTLKGFTPPSPTASRPGSRSFSDICFGSWAQYDETNNGILTLYHGMAYDGARQFLFNPDSHEKYKQQYLRDLAPLLPALGLSLEDIEGIRLTRFGHALPVATRGFIASGILQQASAPIQNTIFFANQDNWANPCFEVAHDCALEATQSILESL